MNVKDVMCAQPRAVRMVDRLDAAAKVLWESDCGFVPVVDGAGVLVGVLTDRDLCMAVYTQGRTLSELPVVAVMARELVTCGPDDPLASVLQAMQKVQVHRVPVVDARGVLLGVVGTKDLVRAAVARPAAVDGHKVLETLARIGQPRSGGRDFAPEAQPAAKSAAKPAAKVAKAAVVAEPAAEPASPKPASKPAAKARSRKRKA